MASVFCRGCGKQVDEEASFCSHCGATQYLQGSSPSVAAVSSSIDYGMWLLAIPVIATALIWIVRSVHIPTAADPIAIIMYVVIGLTAIVGAMEASKIGMKSDRSKGSYGPIAWLIIIGLLWIVGYPAYLYKRRHYGLPNKLVPGILITLIFIGSAFAADWFKPAIAEQQNVLGTETSTTTSKPATTNTSASGDAAFNCADDPDLPKSIDPNITVVEQIRPLTQEEAEAAKVYHMVKGGLLGALGQGDSNGQYVLSQKIPGKILGICVGDAFYHEGDSHMIIFTVSEASNGDNYVAIQDYTEMQGALIIYRAAKQKREEEAKLKAIPPEQPPASEGNTQQETPPAPAEPMKTAQTTASEPVKPSFDCNKATSKVDKLICQSPDLSQWDKRMVETFHERYSQASPQEKTELATTQKEWIKKRNQCDSNKCITDAYQQRDEELVPWEYEREE